MKKLLCFTLALLIVLGGLTACNFTKKLGNLADTAQATPKVEEMMLVLAEDRISDAKALMHPDAADASDDAFTQMSAYLAGREASALKMVGINVHASTGTAGKVRRENISYQITLTDGAVIYLNAVYLSDKHGTGFTSFQLILGVV